MKGIYKLQNLETGRMYLGSSNNLDRRKGEHFTSLDSGDHSNLYLQREYTKYSGKFSFTICEVLPDTSSVQTLRQREEWWISQFWPEGAKQEDSHLYNLNRTPTCSSVWDVESIENRDRHRQRISEGVKRVHAGRSEDQKKQQVEKRRRTMSAKSLEERSEWSRRGVQTRQQKPVDPEKERRRRDRIRATLNSQFEERSRRSRDLYQQLTDDEKKRRSDKVKETFRKKREAKLHENKYE